MSDLGSFINISSGSIQNILGTSFQNQGAKTAAVDDESTFDSVFQTAMNMITSTNDYLQQAQEAEVAYAAGELTSTHELAVIEQKANLSLQYTVAIKNQLLSAYKEIMNLQI